MLGSVNEKTTAIITVDFTDENGTSATPTGGSYNVYTGAGTQVVAPTSFTPTSSSYDINLTVANNTLVDSSLKTEPRIVTVTWTYSGSKQGSAEFRYSVKNLAHV